MINHPTSDWWNTGLLIWKFISCYLIIRTWFKKASRSHALIRNALLKKIWIPKFSACCELHWFNLSLVFQYARIIQKLGFPAKFKVRASFSQNDEFKFTSPQFKAFIHTTFWHFVYPIFSQDFKIQNIVGSCDVKFPIRLEGLAYSHGAFSSVSIRICNPTNALLHILKWKLYLLQSCDQVFYIHAVWAGTVSRFNIPNEAT